MVCFMFCLTYMLLPFSAKRVLRFFLTKRTLSAKNKNHSFMFYMTNENRKI